MADMLDPSGQDSEICADSDINIKCTGNATNKSAKTLVKGKTFDFMTVDFGNGTCNSENQEKKKKKKTNLQESFMKFKKQKQKEILRKRRLKELRKRHRADPGHADRLRQKFVNQAKKYFGVPYARKYWPPESLEYKSPLFLDCCALVRQVLRDLEDDFGFRIGPWNQAYMFDTLPIKVERERDMKPGDLVFMSGIYNKKKRQQKHHMTHVEIWAGDGIKSIGARWNNGKVQVFDSYRFDAKSFNSTEYHFRSIDTWLNGTCKSFCPSHRWKKTKYGHKKKSVFHVQENQVVQQQEQQEDEAAGDSSDNETDDASSRPGTSLSCNTPYPSCSSMPVNGESLLLVQKSERANGPRLFDIEKTYAIEDNLKNLKISVPENVKLEPKKSDKFLDMSDLKSSLENTSQSYPNLSKQGHGDNVDRFASCVDFLSNDAKYESSDVSQSQLYNNGFDNICRSAEPSPDFSLSSDDPLDDRGLGSGPSSPMVPRSKTEICFYRRPSAEDKKRSYIRPSSALSSSGADSD